LRIGHAGLGARQCRDRHRRQLDRQSSQRDIHDGGPRRVSLDDDLRVERYVSDLPDTQHIGAGPRHIERENAGGIGELLPGDGIEGDNGVAEGLAGLGARYGPAQTRMNLGDRQQERADNHKPTPGSVDMANLAIHAFTGQE